DPEFLLSVDVEVEQQVRRLQHHPSIAIWAGNNEIEMIMAVIFKDQRHKDDYYELFVKHIMTRVDREDSTRPFVTSSPSNGLKDKAFNYSSPQPVDPRWGDIHWYDYWSSLWDWKVYKSAKFVSEYGFLSYPSLESLSEALPDSDLTYPLGPGVIHRNRLGLGMNGTTIIQDSIAKYFKLPAHGGVDRINDLIYLSQIFQAMAIKTETEFFRRNREVDPKTGEGYTMGALYWQLNDIWQAPTWASIEYG
ncbi:unnamed protein product, partial [Oppiella nova]